jgi:hypothetical protein
MGVCDSVCGVCVVREFNRVDLYLVRAHKKKYALLLDVVSEFENENSIFITHKPLCDLSPFGLLLVRESNSGVGGGGGDGEGGSGGVEGGAGGVRRRMGALCQN